MWIATGLANSTKNQSAQEPSLFELHLEQTQRYNGGKKKHRTNNLSEGYIRAFALSLSASPSDWHIIDRFRTEEAQARQSMFQAVSGNVDTENSTSSKRKREHREDQLRNVVTSFSNVPIKVVMERIMTFFD
jgi:hypothetical protein